MLDVIDATYFKRRQRERGVTSEDLGRAIGRDRTVISKIYSGQRAIKPEEVPLLAAALDISVEDIIERAGMASPAVVRRLAQPPGMAEGEATPFDWKSRTADEATLSAAFGLNRAGVEAWAVKSDSMDLAGYLKGDIMVVDRNRAERARAGDDVLAQVYDYAAGDARTVFRRYDPPFIYAISTRQTELKPHLVDGERVAIVGVVTFSWRARDRQ